MLNKFTVLILFSLSVQADITLTGDAEINMSGPAVIIDSFPITSMPIYWEGYGWRIIGFEFDGTVITVTKRKDPTAYYLLNCHTLNCNTPNSAVKKEIYGVVDGKIKLIKTILGSITPRKEVAEITTWIDDEKEK